MKKLKFRFLTVILLFCIAIQANGQKGNNHFVFPDFTKATILYKNGQTKSTELNYNKVTEEMIYIAADGKRMALSPINQIDTISFDSRKFVPVENRFYEIVLQGKYPVMVAYKCRLSIAAENIGYGTSSTTAVEHISSLNTAGEVYQLKLPENYKPSPYAIYFIEVNGQLNRIAKVKELCELFPSQKKEITTFVKGNKIKNNLEGIIKTTDFIAKF